MQPKDLDPDYITQARYLYLTGITPAISQSARQTAREFFRLGRENGCLLIMDPNLRLKLWSLDEARRVLIPLMQQCDYVLPGHTELMQLMECDGLDEALDKAHGLGISKLVVKLGEGGALVSLDGGERQPIEPVRLQATVSAMGAGDCFAAGFTAGLIRELPLDECARWGNALGAFCLMGSGPYQTLPDLEEFEEFIRGKESVTR